MSTLYDMLLQFDCNFPKFCSLPSVSSGSDGLSIGGIVGGVIGANLVVIILIVILVLVVTVALRQNKPQAGRIIGWKVPFLPLMEQNLEVLAETF